MKTSSFRDDLQNAYYINASILVVALTECWEWTRSIDHYGYGNSTKDGKMYKAHRLVYEFFRGPIPDGLTIDHLCRNRRCVNPRHLEAVTKRVNTLRGVGAAAQAAKRTHCPQGHPYSAENTHVRRGARFCRECSRMHKRLARLRKKRAVAKGLRTKMTEAR